MDKSLFSWNFSVSRLRLSDSRGDVAVSISEAIEFQRQRMFCGACHEFSWFANPVSNCAPIVAPTPALPSGIWPAGNPQRLHREPGTLSRSGCQHPLGGETHRGAIRTLFERNAPAHLAPRVTRFAQTAQPEREYACEARHCARPIPAPASAARSSQSSCCRSGFRWAPRPGTQSVWKP